MYCTPGLATPCTPGLATPLNEKKHRTLSYELALRKQQEHTAATHAKALTDFLTFFEATIEDEVACGHTPLVWTSSHAVQERSSGVIVWNIGALHSSDL